MSNTMTALRLHWELVPYRDLCYKMSYGRLVRLHSHPLCLLFAYFILRFDMIFSVFALFSSLALLSLAAPQGKIHQITVGNNTGGTIYNPNNIVRQPIIISRLYRRADSLFIQNAAIGDTVIFVFNPKNHSVTQSSFAEPCTPLAGGFNSGLCVFSHFDVSHALCSDTSFPATL